MDHFNYQADGQLWVESIPLAQLAHTYGTPLYVYSRATIERHWKAFDAAAGSQPHLICYAVKANSNIGVLNLMVRLGSGFDIVSGGELERVIAAGGDPGKVVFSGVAKTEAEIEQALRLGIKCFNVESEPELYRINEVGEKLGKRAPISLRINPDVDAKTHPYISTGLKENKFGVEYDRALELYLVANQLPHIEIAGIDCHIGSQLIDLDPFVDAMDKLLELIETLEDLSIPIKHLDIGGGLGVKYNNESPPHPSEYAQILKEKLVNYPDLELIFEPGRAVVANAGVLLTKIEFLKHSEHKNFAIVDAGMNDLLRPTLYQAWQDIVPIVRKKGEKLCYDVVGPVCETGDFLGKERLLCVSAGDLLAIRSAGAYGFSMASNYNSRARACEVLVDTDQSYVVRDRESIASLWALERILPE